MTLKILAMANWKGGVGKTNSTLQLSTLLAEEGKNTLVIDMDAQGNSSNNFGVNKRRSDANTTKDIFTTDKTAEELIVRTQHRHISIIPSNVDLMMTEYNILNKPGREFFLKRFIENNREFLEANFDYIFLDCNPSFNVLNQNAFIVSDSIILVTDCSFNSLDGMEMFYEMWDDAREFLGIKEDNVKAVVINKFNSRTKLHKDMVKAIKSHDQLGRLTLKTLVPESVRFQEAEIEGTMVKNLGFNRKNPYEEIVKALKLGGIL